MEAQSRRVSRRSTNPTQLLRKNHRDKALERTRARGDATVMRTTHIIALCVLLTIGGGVAWCKLAYPAYAYRYRMTVEVVVDGELRFGSSVIEIELQMQPRTLDIPPIVGRVHGDAVYVDLGGGRNVVALLAGGPEAKEMDHPIDLAPRLFPTISYERNDLPKIASLRGRRDVPERALPTLASFDLNDPSNARVVRPDEFETVFGPGVRFQRVWIEMTDEPVTRGIEKKFPWWDGPFPWEKPVGRGISVDTRPPGFRWDKNMLKRDM
jgi:hypothetical protein